MEKIILMDYNQKVLFIVIALVMLAASGYLLIRMPRNKHYLPLEILVVLIAAGAVGNMIDRILYNYVVDFLYFKLIDFPIFNVADIYVTVFAIYLSVLLLFVYKESDLDFIGRKSNL